ncbi:MAG: DUF2950 family protein [Planctomycetota bacterium]
MKKGFTLIELMIVIAIIAIIAAIAIPSLIKSKISANEGAAAAALKTYNGMMATFQKKGYQNKGRVYPTGMAVGTNGGKYCALYYEVNNALERVTLIGVADANADARADGNTADVAASLSTYRPSVKTTTAAPVYQTAATFRSSPKAGYWFAMAMSNGTAYPYNRTQSRNHYGLVAWADDYGASGEATFIINEEGTVYTMDFGGLKQWVNLPGRNPVARNWEIAK